MGIAEIYEDMAYGPAPELERPATDWIAEHEPFGLFIGGRWAAPNTGEYFDVIDPSTGRLLTRVAQASEDDVDEAVQVATLAFEAWKDTPGHVRARYLYALARQIQRHSRLFAVLESLDNGKPIRESRDIDIPLVARHFYYHAGWAQLLAQEFPEFGPVGVAGQIIPWNFPLLMLAWKIAPALACGNTVILKPAEFTPLTALLFAEITNRAGFPPGVVNVVTGDGRTGEAIVRHPDVNKIAFTGSTEVGRNIRRETAGTGKSISLELGGKSPFIVFEDADLDSVVEGVVDAIWFNQGQVCCAGSRLLIEESIGEHLVEKLRVRMERLRVGSPLDKAVDIGAIVAPVQLERIRSLVQQGVDEGAELWQPSWACPTEGYFFPPTLFTNVSPAAFIAQVEIFGPVLVTMTFRTPEEAVTLANNTPYGLAASIWSENINVALDLAPKLKAGTVWINSTNLFDAAAGFGGYRESGFGREGGREGLFEYLKFKTRGADDVKQIYQAPTSGARATFNSNLGSPEIDRTRKLYIGGKQVRPDSGYSRLVSGPDGSILGEVGEGNRKDIRNAVEAADKAASWGLTSGHARAQILYFLAENLTARRAEFAQNLSPSGLDEVGALREVDASIERLFTYAAWADKYDGRVHGTPIRGVTLAMPEPLGIVGIICPQGNPLLALVSLVAPVIALGNRTIVVPSGTWPLAATDLYQVIDTSDVPAGVINIVTGDTDTLSRTLSEHDNVDGIWYFGSHDGARAVEYASAGNLKRTWTHTQSYAWAGSWGAASELFLGHATQVKNIWIPYGV